jgi:hypothetical protein
VLATTVLVSVVCAPALVTGNERQIARCTEKFTEFVPALDKVLTEEKRSNAVIQEVVDQYLRFLPFAECDAEHVISLARQSRFFYGVHGTGGNYTVVFYNSAVRIHIQFWNTSDKPEWLGARTIISGYGAMGIKTADDAAKAREVEARQRGYQP